MATHSSMLELPEGKFEGREVPQIATKGMDVFHRDSLLCTEVDAPPELVVPLFLEFEAVEVGRDPVPLPEHGDDAAAGAEVHAEGIPFRVGELGEEQRVGAEAVVRGDEDRKAAAEGFNAFVVAQGVHSVSSPFLKSVPIVPRFHGGIKKFPEQLPMAAPGMFLLLSCGDGQLIR